AARSGERERTTPRRCKRRPSRRGARLRKTWPRSSWKAVLSMTRRRHPGEFRPFLSQPHDYPALLVVASAARAAYVPLLVSYALDLLQQRSADDLAGSV